jgi:radial spoke head protein 4/6
LLKNESVSDMSSDEEEENDEEETTNNKNIITPEAPIPMFTSCSNDRWPSSDIASPWTIRLNDVVDNSPFVVLQSHIWPGAFSFIKER